MSKKNDNQTKEAAIHHTEVATIGVRTFYAVKILSTQKIVRSLEGIDNK
jgi:hypothetical protein